MDKIGRLFVILSVVLLPLTGCGQTMMSLSNSTPQQQADATCKAFGANTVSGALIGGLLGGVAGAALGKGKTGNIAAGAGAGLLAGALVGKALDARDCREATVALARMETAKVGMQLAWSNPDNGHSGIFTPTSDIKEENGRFCRMYKRDLLVDGKSTTENGITCRTPQGDWEQVS